MPPPSIPAAETDAGRALRRLVEGNARFVRGETTPHPANPAALAQLADEGQHPFAAILGCSDSRVAPEMVFDQGLGELFIVRVAGNIVRTETLGSLGYALEHLCTPLFVVLGHEGCGAVQAALQTKFKGLTQRGKIADLLDTILPGLQEIDPTEPDDVQMYHAVEANVRWSLRQLKATAAAQAALAEKRIQLVGAVYQLATGHVRFLPED